MPEAANIETMNEEEIQSFIDQLNMEIKRERANKAELQRQLERVTTDNQALRLEITFLRESNGKHTVSDAPKEKVKS